MLQYACIIAGKGRICQLRDSAISVTPRGEPYVSGSPVVCCQFLHVGPSLRRGIPKGFHAFFIAAVCDPVDEAIGKKFPAKKGVGAGCSGSANYYKQKGQFHTSGPQPGDQIFFTNDGGKTMYHTGIVEKVAGGRVYTIEGNTSSAAGVVENGGCVRDKSYALTYSKIGGYGRPDFSIVPEEDDDMDQNKFNEMFKVAMTAHQKELQDNDCGEWSREAREWAIRVGLFAGNGTTADGQPNYMWASPLTREQAAQLFYRFAQDHGLA